ncbi:hypothetical protein ACIQ6R_18225 [Streptomyces sp. NPDC096048]|uniref:hypothetical protein n=1 Tax=Streptomyces sp. NPDC096048 TaxID=3366072 RepID=UPI00381A871F
MKDSAVQTVPGPTFAAGIQLATGVHRGDGFAVAQVLAYHVPPSLAGQTVGDISRGMEAIARAMHLGPCETHPPYIGHRIRMRSGTPFLDYGRDDYLLALPVGEEWRTLVEAGGPVRILVMLDPRPAGLRQPDLSEFVRDAFTRRAMRWGTTYHV